MEEFERVYIRNPLHYVVDVHSRLAPEPVAAVHNCFGCQS
jgi:hypothetical protein